MGTEGQGDDALIRAAVRMPARILRRIDKAAEELGITRTAFLVQAAVEKLRKEEIA